MTDARALARQYLEQQRALGGNPVILTTQNPMDSWALQPGPIALEISSTPALRPGSVTSERPSVPQTQPALTPGASPGNAPRAVPSQPDLPPPGLIFDPPGGDLFSADPIPRAPSLDAIAALVAECIKCRLCESRTHTVPGEGPAGAKLVVVGEGPGRTEDATGRPFVGKAGDLLTKILAAISLPREQVFICNVVKCRPPENRLPLHDEVEACAPYLFRQLDLLQPRVILAMGGTAAQTLLNTKQSLGALRNKVHRFRGIPLIVTYHPAALLRNPNWKKPTWDDVRIARRLFD